KPVGTLLGEPCIVVGLASCCDDRGMAGASPHREASRRIDPGGVGRRGHQPVVLSARALSRAVDGSLDDRVPRDAGESPLLDSLPAFPSLPFFLASRPTRAPPCRTALSRQRSCRALRRPWPSARQPAAT